MTDDWTATVHRLFWAGLDLSVKERAAFLDQHCHDATLRAEVDSLLAHHRAAAGFLSTPPIPKLGEPLEGPPIRQLGDFRISREIGRGGMGVVYLAEELPLGRKVALKVLRSHFARWEPSVARFRQEARAAAKLQHPGIVPIYRFGEENGIHYISTEYIEGITLDEKLSRVRRLQDGGASDPVSEPSVSLPSHRSGSAFAEPVPVPKSSVLRSDTYLKASAGIIAAVAEALEYAHEHGVIHRDVKPSNILIDTEGKPRLADFGLAKNLDDQTVSRTGDIAGTLLYMSPEQAMPDRGKLDHRTDIFSLGIVLYEILTLRRPFEGGSVHQILDEVATKDPKLLRAVNPKVPRDLETICRKAIEKKPDDRYQRAGDLAADLTNFIAGEPIRARPLGFVRRTGRFARKHRAVAVAGCIGILALLAGILIARSQLSREARLSVTANHVGASVHLREFNIRTRMLGESKLLGVTPLTGVSVPVGYYRIVVAVDGVGFAEMTRLLEVRRTYELYAQIRPTEDVVAGMQHMPAGKAIVGQAKGTWAGHENREVVLDAFWIDPAEVSNREYKEFLDDTSRPWPALWGGQYRRDWGDLPLVGITWTEAQAYAEWAGKRLPTDIEWERAARGSAGRTFPWGSEGESIRELANVLKDENRAWTDVSELTDASELKGLLQYYQDSVVPVTGLPGGLRDVTPDGLYHTLGNVIEWTESIHFVVVEGEIRPNYFDRIIKGDHWGSSESKDRDLRFFLSATIDSPLISRGFRCAKSARP